MSIVYVGLGSNLGNREANLQQALTKLQQAGAHIELVSSWRETKPYGVTDQPDFLNGVAKLTWQDTADELLTVCLKIEKELGRVRKRHWGERTIDLDILFFDQAVINTSRLVVPHPDLENRLFVLEPLNEIAPQLKHPLLGKTIQKLFKNLQKREGAQSE